MNESKIIPQWAKAKLEAAAQMMAVNEDTTAAAPMIETKVQPKWTQEMFAVMEGKQQAMQILQDKEMVNKLADIDPTKNNKYVTLFAKFFKAGTSIEDIKALAPHIAEAEQKKIVIDVTKMDTFEDFKSAITAHANKITGGAAKKGIEGIKEGIDYMDFGPVEVQKTNDSGYEKIQYHGYIPLNWEASKVIASSRVAGCEGKWCISYQKDKSYWNSYVKNKRELFLILVSEDTNLGDDQKLAIEFDKEGFIIEVWNANDKNSPASDYFVE